MCTHHKRKKVGKVFDIHKNYSTDDLDKYDVGHVYFTFQPKMKSTFQIICKKDYNSIELQLYKIYKNITIGDSIFDSLIELLDHYVYDIWDEYDTVTFNIYDPILDEIFDCIYNSKLEKKYLK